MRMISLWQAGAAVGLAGLQWLTDESDSRDLQPPHTSITAQMMVLHEFGPELHRRAAKKRWQLGPLAVTHRRPQKEGAIRVDSSSFLLLFASLFGVTPVADLSVQGKGELVGNRENARANSSITCNRWKTPKTSKGFWSDSDVTGCKLKTATKTMTENED